eukprot:350874-Chlamydomonas_euryale.AAC.17
MVGVQAQVPMAAAPVMAGMVFVEPEEGAAAKTAAARAADVGCVQLAAAAKAAAEMEVLAVLRASVTMEVLAVLRASTVRSAVAASLGVRLAPAAVAFGWVTAAEAGPSAVVAAEAGAGKAADAPVVAAIVTMVERWGVSPGAGEVPVVWANESG